LLRKGWGTRLGVSVIEGDADYRTRPRQQPGGLGSNFHVSPEISHRAGVAGADPDPIMRDVLNWPGVGDADAVEADGGSQSFDAAGFRGRQHARR
jgi:hypothetical protein